MITAQLAQMSSLHEQVLLPGFDEAGFLLDSMEWNEELAVMIAQLDGVGQLGREHWAVIRSLRELYLKFESLPPMRRICRKSSVSRERVKELFGGCRQVWRLAGLPHPGEEALAYMG